MRLAAGITAALLLAAPAKGDPSTDEVLVLGVQTPKGLSTWLVDTGGIREAGEGLAIPRANGWWKLVQLERQKDKASETLIWATPAARPVPPKPMAAQEGCEQSTTESLLFAGSDYYSVEFSGGGYCEGTAHPWHTQTLLTYPLDPVKHKAVAIGAILGGAASKAMDKASATAHGGPEKREKDCLGDPSEENWGLIRSQGRWVARGALPYAAEACRQNYEYFTLDAPVDPKVTGAAAPLEPWSRYSREHPGITDVVVPPGGSFELTVSPTGLEVFVNGKSAARQALEKPAVVMTQFALGKAAARWRTDVLQALVPRAGNSPRGKRAPLRHLPTAPSRALPTSRSAAPR